MRYALFIIAVVSILGCDRPDAASQLEERARLGNTRRELFQRMVEKADYLPGIAGEPAKMDLHLEFELPDGTSIDSDLAFDSLTTGKSKTGYYHNYKDYLDLDESMMPKEYRLSPRWRWSRYHRQPHEYTFNEAERVSKIVIHYCSEAPIVPFVTGLYWLGCIPTFLCLLYAQRSMSPTNSAEPQLGLFVRLNKMLKPRVIAIFVGMLVLCVCAAIIDFEILLAVSAMVLPILLAVVCYTLAFMLTKSTLIASGAFFILPLALSVYCFAETYLNFITLT